MERSFTKWELIIIDAINEAKTYAKHELELDFIIPAIGDGEAGWYAFDYIENQGAEPIFANEYDTKPLVSYDVEKIHEIDVPNICDYLGVAYCG